MLPQRTMNPTSELNFLDRNYRYIKQIFLTYDYKRSLNPGTWHMKVKLLAMYLHKTKISKKKKFHIVGQWFAICNYITLTGLNITINGKVTLIRPISNSISLVTGFTRKLHHQQQLLILTLKDLPEYNIQQLVNCSIYPITPPITWVTWAMWFLMT